MAAKTEHSKMKQNAVHECVCVLVRVRVCVCVRVSKLLCLHKVRCQGPLQKQPMGLWDHIFIIYNLAPPFPVAEHLANLLVKMPCLKKKKKDALSP